MKEIKEDFYEERETSLRDIFNIFLMRKSLFSVVSIILFLSIVLFKFLKPYKPVYLAIFDIGVSERKPVEGFFSQTYEAPGTQIGTVTQRVISNLLSAHLAEEVVDSLSLYVYIKDGNKKIKIQPEILKDYKEPLGPLKIKIQNSRLTITLPNKKGLILQYNLSDYINLDFLKFKIIPLSDINGKTFTVTFYPKKSIAQALRNSLSIKVLEADRIEKEGNLGGVPFSGEGVSKKLLTAKTIFPGFNLIGILRIYIYWGNPDDALQIAEFLTRQIIKKDIREKSIQFIQSRKFIESQLAFYREKLTELEEKIKRFKEEKKIADLKSSTQALISQISQLETKMSQLEIEQSILKNLEEYLAKGKEIDTTVNFAPALLSDPVLQSFYSDLIQTEVELKGRLKSYSPNHPKVYEVMAKLDGLKEQMKEEIRKRVATIKTEIQSVKNQINYLKTNLEDVPGDEVQLARMERDKETAEKLYTFFAEKLEETKVKEAGVTSDLKIINPPFVLPRPVNTKRPFLIFLIALIISVLAGTFAVFIAEYLDNTLKDPELIEARTGLPVFGSIPLAEQEEKGIRKFIKREKLREELRIVSTDLFSGEFEAFRKLSLNLGFAHPEKKYRVLYITSPSPEEGKTFITFNLGFVYASKGNKALVIDSDFRKKKGHITDLYNIKNEKGIFDILTDKIKPEEGIFKIKQKGKSEELEIDFMPVGNTPPNPFVFLESKKMKNLIEDLRENYDIILIDGAPIRLFADSVFIANYADGAILIVKYGKTTYNELEEAKNILKNSRSDLIGVVINGVPRKRGSYYYYYYYKYYSRYYGKKE